MPNETDVINGLLLRWRRSPLLFAKECLGFTHLEKWQEEAISLYANNKRIAIKSGHGVGKSAFLVIIGYHNLITNAPCKVICTAPTAHQLYDVLWSEFAKWGRRMRPEIFNEIDIKADRISLKAIPHEAFIVARTARREQPEAFQGFHGDRLVFIADEASGVDDIIFEVGEGSMSTPNTNVILTSNPTRREGYFFEAFKPDSGYKTMTVSCNHSSLVAGDYKAHMASKYGEDSDVYRVRVLGEFPHSTVDSIISRIVVEEALEKQVTQSLFYPVWGVDVARYGSNKTALAKRQGNHLLEPVKMWSRQDTMSTVARIVDEYEMTPHELRPYEIYVDVVGMGAGVVDRLAELKFPVVGINVQGGSAWKEVNLNLKSDLWCRARDWFLQQNVSIPNQPELVEQLVAVGYKYQNGKFRVESKEDLMSRSVASPDAADAFVLTFAGGYDILQEEVVHQVENVRKRYQRRFKPNLSWMAL